MNFEAEDYKPKIGDLVFEFPRDKDDTTYNLRENFNEQNPINTGVIFYVTSDYFKAIWCKPQSPGLETGVNNLYAGFRYLKKE